MSSVKVDTLTMSVEAEAKGAVKELEDLKDSLYEVRDAADDTSTSTAETADKFSELAQEASKLTSVARGMGLDHYSKSLADVAKQANRAAGIKDFTQQIKNLAKEYEKLGANDLADKFKDLSDPLKMESDARASDEAAKSFADGEKLMTRLFKQEKAEQVAAAKEAAAKAAAAAKEAADKQKAADEDLLQEYKSIADEIEDITKERAAKQKEAAELIAQGEKDIADIVKNLAKEKAAAEKASIEETWREYSEIADEIEFKAKEKADIEKEAAEERKRAEQEMTEEVEAQMRKVDEELELEAKLAEDLSKKAKEAKKGLVAFGEAHNPLQKLSNSFKKLARTIARIAMYRAIRTMIKNISAAVKEGLSNLYAYSKEVGTAFTPAVDNLRQHVLMLKNAFATALRPVIESLIPIIIQLVDWFSKLADFVAQVLSVLTGKVDDKGRYTKAVLGDLEESNKQAKELRRTLLGFDEINRLDAPNKSSDENNNAVTMFEQADVSPEAEAVAEKIGKAWEKVKEVIAQIDWEKVAKIVGVLILLKAGFGLVNKLKAVWELLKQIGTLLGKTGIWGIILAIIAIFALWGDKIGSWLSKAAIKIRNYLQRLQLKIKSVFAYSIVKTIGEALSFIIDIIGDIADGIYKLFHGDFKGALDAGVKLLKDILKLLVSLIGGFINIFLGWVSDVINNILEGVRWLWNNGIAPIINFAATVLHNAFINLKLSFWYLAEALLTAVNWALSKVEAVLNAAIAAWNLIMNDDVEPLNLRVDSSSVESKIKELESMKLNPLTEPIEFVGEWKEPAKVKLQIDTTAAYRAIDRIGEKVNRLGTAISSVAGGLAATSGSNAALKWNMTKYASGGFPSVGSVFIAGESGPELVTNINGQTGVYNTDQMAAAIYNAMTAALANAPRSGGGDIYLDGEVIYRNVVNRNNNQVRSTGRAALLT